MNSTRIFFISLPPVEIIFKQFPALKTLLMEAPGMISASSKMFIRTLLFCGWSRCALVLVSRFVNIAGQRIEFALSNVAHSDTQLDVLI
jgi:hypothetical protein